MMNPTRRDFIKTLGMGASALGCAGAMGREAVSAAKPNFLFILADDMGWNDPACYGNEFHETPNIDQLGREGMLFTDAYAACPVCSPTRASIMAGQYPARVGVIDFITGHWRPYEKLRVPKNRTQYLPLEVETIAEALKPAGYTSALFGKWHLGWGKYTPTNQGFDVQRVTGGPHYKFRTNPKDDLSPELNQAEYLTQECEQFLEANQNNPFCCFVTHFAVHIPLQADQDLIHKYANKTAPEKGVNHPVYAAMVEHVDQSVGRLMKKLDELGLSENTVVVFFSDNGGLRKKFTGEGPVVTTNAPLRDEKGTLYEGGIREPMIVRWPGKIQAGSVCHTPVTSVDFYPTFLELAGAKTPDQPLDGESLAPLLKQTGGLTRDAIYWHYPVYHHSVPAGAIREGEYKLIEFFDDNHVELYNLVDDIGETNNLAEKRPHVAARLRKKLADWRESVDARLPVPNPDFNPARRHEWGRHPDRG
ncbi:sulfatase-like hydrolase/transferase [bacterium]|nr:sulfatase-like hydrolase/transferase [bacterium]